MYSIYVYELQNILFSTIYIYISKFSADTNMYYWTCQNFFINTKRVVISINISVDKIFIKIFAIYVHVKKKKDHYIPQDLQFFFIY